jgi:protein TonB
MKKMAIYASGRIFLPAIFCGLVITGCTSNDTNPPSSASGATDTATTPNHQEGPSAPADQTNVANMDSSGATRQAGPDSASAGSRDSGAKAKPATPKKGKVSLLPTQQKASTAAVEKDKDGIYASTEVLPAFPGGQKALERFFEDNIRYPEAATENGAAGTVNLSFNVDENGKIYKPLALGEKIGYGIEDEAIRVFNKMPAWTPGKVKGKNVKTRFMLPIRFQID